MKNTTIIILVAVILLVVGVIWMGITSSGKKFGTAVNYDVNTFLAGITIGTSANPGCIKMVNITGGGSTYVYTTSTGAVSSSSIQPYAGACNAQ
jgi:hypothetical protein